MITKGCLVTFEDYANVRNNSSVYLAISDPYEGGPGLLGLGPDNNKQVVDILYKGKVVNLYTGLLELVSQ